MHKRIAYHLSAAWAEVCLLFSSLWTAGAADCIPITIVKQPESVLRTENCTATFSVTVAGTSPYFYQWWINDYSIPGETNSNFTTALTSLADDGTRFRVTITNGCSQAISVEAWLHIILDNWPPRLLRARSDATLERVIVTFFAMPCGGSSLDLSTAQDPLNYAISGGIIVSNALIDATGTNVILNTGRQVPGAIYTLTVSDVVDAAGNPIPSDSQTPFQAWVLAPESDPPMIVPPPVHISRSGAVTFISWPPGSLLQQADRVSGPWHILPTPAFPYETTNTDANAFFRAVFYP